VFDDGDEFTGNGKGEISIRTDTDVVSFVETGSGSAGCRGNHLQSMLWRRTMQFLSDNALYFVPVVIDTMAKASPSEECLRRTHVFFSHRQLILN
jgi:hypothetical protein